MHKMCMYGAGLDCAVHGFFCYGVTAYFSARDPSTHQSKDLTGPPESN